MRALYLASVFLHILAAMTWIGGMVMFVGAVMPVLKRRDAVERDAFLGDFGPRFGRVAWTSFAVLVVTGVVNLSMRGVHVSDFLREEWRASSFGHGVLLKLGLVLLALALSLLHTRVASRTRARWLGRLSLIVGLAIVAAAVALVRGS
jgi:copper resistance protein D